MWRSFSVVAIALAVARIPAAACTCGTTGKGGCQIPSADVIALARVVSTEQFPSERAWGKVVVQLDVIEQFRGEPVQRLVVRTETQTSACGYRFQTGHEYLVFASADSAGLRVDLCSATQPAKAAASRIRQLRAIRDGTTLPALFGSVVTQPLEQGEDLEEYVQPVPGLTVVAEADDREYRTVTAHDGTYEFLEIPRGEYRVHAVAPVGRLVLWSGGAERPRTPAGLEPRCAMDFQMFRDGRLSGTVSSRDGGFLSGFMTAEYVDPGRTVSPRFQSAVSAGRFEIPRLWPGRYRLEFREAPQYSDPVYYPGTTSKSEATLVELADGEKIDNLQLVVF